MVVQIHIYLNVAITIPPFANMYVCTFVYSRGKKQQQHFSLKEKITFPIDVVPSSSSSWHHGRLVESLEKQHKQTATNVHKIHTYNQTPL